MGSFVVLLPLVVLFYLLMVRPQKRRQNQHQQMVDALVPGDEIVTIGGVIGYVKAVEDEYVRLEVADGCVLRVVKQAVGRKVTDVDLEVPDEGADEGAADEPHEAGDSD